MFATDEPTPAPQPGRPAGAGRPPACLLRIKAVPGARRDEIVGPLGDRLKVRVAAPPEDGRANDALCALIADALGLPTRAISVVVGPGSALKTLRVEGVTAREAVARLA
jgi:uncharacterized protein (TIGR00251 family)